MVTPTEIIRDIQERLDRMVRDYHHLQERNKQLESENKILAHSLEEAVKQKESYKHKLDTINLDTLREAKGLDQWKKDTRAEVRNLIKEVEKCIPQVEAMLENK
jgi:cell division septum initiation protein DivIVA